MFTSGASFDATIDAFKSVENLLEFDANVDADTDTKCE